MFLKYTLATVIVLSINGCTLPNRSTDVEAGSCVIPKDDISIAEHQLEAKANVYKLGEIVDANITYKQKAERIREEIAGINSLEVWEYRLCFANENGRITNDQYSKHLDNMTNILKEMGVPEKKSG